MSLRPLLVVLSCALGHVALAQQYRPPVEWEINLEGGVDLRPEYSQLAQTFVPYEGVLRDGLRQQPSPFAGVSAMRRIPGLRALWGLRLDAHLGTLSLDGAERYEVDHATATATLAYRFFPLDLQGDCDCPTWGNDPWLKKALFLEAGLGGGYQRYGSTDEAVASRERWGAAYAARIGVSHRFSKAVDLYAAVGLHGILADNEAFRSHDYALRPALGITYRPGG